ncbi:MAG: molybdopterin molybdotransferase MoeA, partial [Bdellovibrionota bacterium]
AQWTQSASSIRPQRFQVAQCITAGDAIQLVESGTTSAVQIMTGAPLPGSGSESLYNSVIKVEEVKVLREIQGRALEIEISRPLKRGENVRKCGEDFMPGQKVASRGTVLLPEHVMAMASLGISEVQVYSKPRVGIISTGRELVDYKEPGLKPGMIRNSSGPYLASIAPLFGCEAEFLGTILDDPVEFESLVMKNLSRFDILITTGAVSMGIHDFVGESLHRVGAKNHFHKVAIRPGKPVLFAEFNDGPVVFGAPGNPISTSVCWRFFVVPYLRAISKRSPESPFFGKLSKSVSKPEDLRCFFKAKVDFSKEKIEVECLKGQASFMVSPLLASNAWAVLSEGTAEVQAGSNLELYPLYPKDDFTRENIQTDSTTKLHAECCS